MFTTDGAFDETPTPSIDFSLRLGSIKSTRQSMSRLIRERAKNNVSERDFKALIWGLSQLQAYWRLELDSEVEKRIEALEARLQ